MAGLVTDKSEKGASGLLESLSELAGLRGRHSGGRGQVLTQTLQGSGWRSGTKGEDGQGSFFADVFRFRVKGEESLLRDVGKKGQGEKHAWRQEQRETVCGFGMHIGHSCFPEKL